MTLCLSVSRSHREPRVHPSVWACSAERVEVAGEIMIFVLVLLLVSIILVLLSIPLRSESEIAVQVGFGRCVECFCNEVCTECARNHRSRGIMADQIE